MGNQVIGKIKVVEDTKEYGSNGFKKRGLVVETEEQYPQLIYIEFVKDKESLLDMFSEGERVKVDINLRGREWVNPEGESKFFNSLEGWKIENA